MKSRQQIQWHALILGLAIFMGSLVRFAPGLMAGFPLDDGGMFYVMMRDLRLNHYVLPLQTTYNSLNIPFTYPPFGFYVGAFLRGVLQIPELEILRWVPVLTSILSIFVFYHVAVNLLNDRPRAALAAVFYALTPGGYFWYILGGSLTRSFGGLFLLCSVYFLYRVFQFGSVKDTALAAVSCSLAVLSHPEAGLHTAGICALLWIAYGRSRSAAIRAFVVALGTLALTSPWWALALSHHGFAPYLSAFHTGMYHQSPLRLLVSGIFDRQSFVPVLVVLRLAGIAWSVWKRRYFLLLWMMLPYFVEPRFSPAVAQFPFAILAALGLADALPAVTGLFQRNKPAPTAAGSFTEIPWMNLVILGILFYLFVECGLYSYKLVNTTLTSESVQAMTWVRENLPGESRFLVLTGNAYVMADPSQEWFPALTERHSQTTLQGLEWLLAEGFLPRHDALVELQTCPGIACVEDWSVRNDLGYSHLFVEQGDISEDMLVSIRGNAEYRLVFENQKVDIFQYNEKPGD